MGTRRYRQHSAADKVAILRQVLVEGHTVSKVCEEHAGLLDDDEIAWFWIGTHAAYDRLLEDL